MITKKLFTLLLLSFLSVPSLSENIEPEGWVEEAKNEFREWYPEVKEEYLSKNGAFSDSDQEELFKREAWSFLLAEKEQRINALLDKPFHQDELIHNTSSVNSAQRSKILKSGVPQKAFDTALKKMSSQKVKKKDRMVIIDFTKKSTERRFFLINLKTGAVQKHHVAHGKLSGAKGGRATSFSSKAGSDKTPKGFHVTRGRGRHKSKWGSRSLIIDGIENTNRNTLARGVVAHGASYVSDGGRSNGCPALDTNVAKQLFPTLTDGVLWYHYAGQ